MSNTENKDCSCTPLVQTQESKNPLINVKKTAGTFRSMLLGVVIAFFPKCPVCLAAYLSMFGSFSLANTPLVGWIFPLLLTFLGLHLLLMLKKLKKKGYGPFLLSLAGATMILCGRMLLDQNKIVLIGGMLFILSGSLWNSFSTTRFQLPLFRFKNNQSPI